MLDRSRENRESLPYTAADCRLALDRSTPVPLWAQIEEFLATAILDRRLQAGQALGSEPELAARFSVCRPTVRQALQSLHRRGLITRSRGRETRVAAAGVGS